MYISQSKQTDGHTADDLAFIAHAMKNSPFFGSALVCTIFRHKQPTQDSRPNHESCHGLIQFP